MSGLASWRPALRIAFREVWRARVRSALVLLLVALPVLGVVVLDTLYRTSEVSVAEGLDRTLGQADALVRDVRATGPVLQTPDAQAYLADGDRPVRPLTASRLQDLLGGDARLVEVPARGLAQVRTRDGVAQVQSWALALGDPMTTGLVRPQAGRFARSSEEVTVSTALAARGPRLGAVLRLADGTPRRVVGIVDSADQRDALLVTGAPGSLAPPSDPPSFLVDVPGGVSWTRVRHLDRTGLLVLSRAAVLDPPPASQVPAQVRQDGVHDTGSLTVLALVAAMAVLEVVLLAGPAMAVGARRAQRSHALMRAAGARPRDVRRAVLATGVVLGGIAAVAGGLAGVVAARVTEPLAQRVVGGWFGPFEVSGRDIGLVMLVGFASAVIAAYVPARLATRLDVVAVLAGRRGEPAPSYRSPVLGALLLATGVLAAAHGARQASGDLIIVAGAVLSVLGMVLLVPVALALTGRLAGRLPLSARYAVRDAARQRSRTAPAVAAVAATVAGVVALGIGSASDAEQEARTYSPSGPSGAAVITLAEGSPADWPQVSAVARRALPHARALVVRGLGAESPYVEFDNPSSAAGSSYDNGLGTSVLAAPVDLARLQVRFDPARLPQARDVLARGGAVVLQPGPSGVVMRNKMSVVRYDDQGNESSRRSVSVPTLFVTPYGYTTMAQAVVAPSALRRVGITPVTTALVLDGTRIDAATEERLRESLQAVAPGAQVSVERGYHDDGGALVTLLLGVVGGALMLGGTLTATFLALSDARPDLATLAAIGAAPRRRRAVAASYAVTTALLGSLLGAAVGFVPGVAITFPLTRGNGPGTDLTGQPLPGHFLDVPWLLVLGLVVVLPLLTGLLVAAVTRSRLPMVARLS